MTEMRDRLTHVDGISSVKTGFSVLASSNADDRLQSAKSSRYVYEHVYSPSGRKKERQTIYNTDRQTDVECGKCEFGVNQE